MPVPVELEPTVFANKFMLKPIDQAAETSILSGPEYRRPEPPYQCRNILPPRPGKLLGQAEGSDEECDCNLTRTYDADPRRYMKEQDRLERDYVAKLNQYRSLSSEKELVYRDAYQPHRYEALIEKEDSKSYQLYSQNIGGSASEITSDNTKKRRQVSFKFDKPPKP
jgi:hypothetical protein